MGPLRLLRYERGKQPSSGAEQAALDTVLAPYVSLAGTPIAAATILTIGGYGIIEDKPEEALYDLFRYGDLIAFAGLSGRQFFRHLRYANRDTFRLVVQGFTEPGRGVLVSTRRRDGVANIHYTRGTYRVTCPPHVGVDASDLDIALLNGLISCEADIAWPRLFQALVLFNEANTDRDFLPDAAELVLSYASLEQILDIPANPRRLAERFEALWEPLTPLGKEDWSMLPPTSSLRDRLARATSLRAAWIEDMGISRGSLAHGHGAEAYRSVWSPREHLLFAAFATPRLFKLCLASRNHYGLSATDTADVDAFETLLNSRHFDERNEDEGHPWLDAIASARTHRWVLEAWDRLSDQSGPAV